MNNNNGLPKKLVGVLLCFYIAGCSQTDRPNGQQLTSNETKTSNKIEQTVLCEQSNSGLSTILANEKALWSECFEHTGELFSEVLQNISQLLQEDNLVNSDKHNRLDKLFYYLRAYSYWGELNELEEAQWQALHKVMVQLTESSLLVGTSDSALRIQEHFFVTLYQYYPSRHAKGVLDNLLPELMPKTVVLLENSLANSTSLQAGYRDLEFYRAIGFIAYSGVSNEAIKTALIQENLLSNTLSELLPKLSNLDWQRDHALWTLAKLYMLSDEEQQKVLDENVQQFLFSDSGYDDELAKQLFSEIYLANSIRTRDHCENEFKGKCLIKSVEQVLPIKHDCSDTLFIRANQMTDEQLALSCQKLIAQEDFFHQTIATAQQPVANDFNDKLRVVIFNNYSQYNRHGQLTFNIFTDNGGMYIEGTPNADENQATFYSFEAFWQQPEFSVWNLAHEYVHYLDGRFVKYGGFGHFPEKLVWWTEGLAEYIAKQNDNNKAFELARDTKQEEWPTLADIFATTYEDGTDRVYRWSYLAQRFIFNFYPKEGQKMAMYLKRDYFAGYENELSTFANAHQAEFNQWLIKAVDGLPLAKEEKKTQTKQPQYLYRYLYRDYLRPKHLPITEKHKHFSNWG